MVEEEIVLALSRVGALLEGAVFDWDVEWVVR